MAKSCKCHAHEKSNALNIVVYSLTGAKLDDEVVSKIVNSVDEVVEKYDPTIASCVVRK